MYPSLATQVYLSVDDDLNLHCHAQSCYVMSIVYTRIEVVCGQFVEVSNQVLSMKLGPDIHKPICKPLRHVDIFYISRQQRCNLFSFVL